MTRVIGWIVALFGVLCLLGYAGALLVFDEVPDPVNYVGAVGVGSILLWLVADWQNLSRMGEDQTVARSFTSAFAILLVLAITTVVNVGAVRYDWRKDVTATKRFSLSEQSVDVVSKLDEPVVVHAWFQGTDGALKNFRSLMEEYADHTTLLTVEYHDPFEDRILAEEQKILSTAGTVILKKGDREQRLESSFDEEAFTNGLVRVSSSIQHTVCVTTDHGELDPDDEYSQTGLGIAKIRLEGQNYTFNKISLLATPPTPEGCAVTILGGPRTELLPMERDRLAAYVAGGGKLIVMLDPATTPETAADLARFGVKVGNDVVIEGDPNRQSPEGPTAVILDPSSFDFSPITEKLKGFVQLVMVRSVSKGPEVVGLNVQELARTTDQSWAETTLDSTTPPTPDADKDIVGRVPVVVTVEVTDPAGIVTTSAAAPAVDAAGLPIAAPVATGAPVDIPRKAGGKLMVVGDSDFASNLYLTRSNNQDLLFNTIAWMVGEVDQLTIRANDATEGQLELGLLGSFFAGTTMLLLVPGVTIAAAMVTWFRRKGR